MKQIASQLGFIYERYDRSDRAYRNYNLELFQRSHDSEAYNIITGDKFGNRIELFDYLYTINVTGPETYKETHKCSICLIITKHNFKNLLIRPEDLSDKIASAVGFQDINFESKEFNRRFRIQASDKKFAYDIIHPQMIEFLLSKKGVPYIEMRDNLLMFYAECEIKPAQYISLFNFAWDFYLKIPQYIL